jgi:hypothetical protein
MFVCCECCVLSRRSLCDELITRLEESYRLWCVVVCDQETSTMRRPCPALGRSSTEKKKSFCLRFCLPCSATRHTTRFIELHHLKCWMCCKINLKDLFLCILAGSYLSHISVHYSARRSS